MGPDPQHCLQFCGVAGGPGAARQEVRHGGEHQAGPHEAEALAPAGPDQGPPEAAGHLHHVPVSFFSYRKWISDLLIRVSTGTVQYIANNLKNIENRI